MGRSEVDGGTRDFRRAFFSIARRLRLDFLGVKTSEGVLLSWDVGGISPGLKERRRDDFFEAAREGAVGRTTTGVVSAWMVSSLEGEELSEVFNAGMDDEPRELTLLVTRVTGWKHSSLDVV